tara:strand:+ start:23 stop:625 length:603 start_codon:yes stop_codon:yes gene_type:complete
MEYKQMVSNSHSLKLTMALTMAVVMASSQTLASALTVPNSFTSGTATSASDMNANFTAVKAAVDDNNTRISSLEGATSSSSFKGFSSGTTQGNGGLITMGNLCNTSFTGSHVCTTLEFASASYTGATGLSGNAWIQARGLSKGTSASVTDQVSLISGHTSTITCNGWTSNSSTNGGLAVSSVGGFTAPQCSNTLAVACCN